MNHPTITVRATGYKPFLPRFDAKAWTWDAISGGRIVAYGYARTRIGAHVAAWRAVNLEVRR